MRLKCDFEVMDINDEKIAVPVGDHASEFHGVIKLNDTGAFILGLLKQETSEDDIVKAMMSRYDACKEEIEKDTKQCIAEFAKVGLITSQERIK